MMKKALVILADGFEEIEAVTVIDILRRAGVDVVVAGLHGLPLKGSRAIRIVPDTSLDNVREQEFDLVVLPGGQPGVDHLKADPRVVEILKKTDQKKNWIGAICAAPLVLQEAGLVKGKKVTCFPSVETELRGIAFREDRVVVDGHLVTSRSPGTALEFALELVNLLVGREKSEEISRTVLAKA